MVRAGRLRSPVYMYSESLDVGFSYPWLRLPDEVYSQVQLTNYEGADVVYTLPLSYGSVTFQVAAGQAKNRDYFAYDDLFSIDYGKLFGANVSLATNDYGTFRVGPGRSRGHRQPGRRQGTLPGRSRQHLPGQGQVHEGL